LIPIKSLGHPELARLLRRRGVATGAQNREQMDELFRRMVFNLLIDDTDDHEKTISCSRPRAARCSFHPLLMCCPREPEARVVIPGSGGCRKLRWSRPGMGKQGGARVI